MSEETYSPLPNSFVRMLCVCVMYDIERLSTAFQTDRPELVNRCCWSS